MIELLFQIGLSNALFAGLLAVVAMIVGSRTRRPQLTYFLWLLVLVKLVTPPIVNIPIEFPAAQQPTRVTESPTSNDSLRLLPLESSQFDFSRESEAPAVVSWQSLVTARWIQAKPWIGSIWLIGSLLIVTWSLYRVWRFHRLLMRSAVLAKPDVNRVARRMGWQLGLSSLPRIFTTSARISPMVWWVGGRVQVILPNWMFDELNKHQWQWVLAHELAHVRRRDFLVRWLEWLACVCFWWNPVVWWAQRNLRASEEICCDALVLACLKPDTRSYADSILTAVESLVSPVVRPPAMASEINSGGFLTRRIEMIMSNKSGSGRSRICRLAVITLALVVIPFGVAGAQDFEKVHKRLMKSVKRGELTQQQADAMMTTLKKMTDNEKNERQDLGAGLRHAIADGALQKLKSDAEAEQKTRVAIVEGLEWRDKERREKAAPRDDWKGKMTPQEGREKNLKWLKEEPKTLADRHAYREANEMIRENKMDSEYRKREAGIKLREAVAEGELTGEQARERYEGVLKKLQAQDDADSKNSARKKTRRAMADADPDEIEERIEQRLRQGVADGKLTEGQARERYEGILKMLATGKEKGKSGDQLQRLKEVVDQRARGSIADREMTKAEGRERIEELLRRIKEAERRENEQTQDRKKQKSKMGEEEYLKSIELKIRQAIAAGELTPEEGKAKMEALLRRIAGKKKAESNRQEKEEKQKRRPRDK